MSLSEWNAATQLALMSAGFLCGFIVGWIVGAEGREK